MQQPITLCDFESAERVVDQMLADLNSRFLPIP